MWLLKGCPRCSGDLQFCTDVYGKYWYCAQCSHEIYVEVKETASPDIIREPSLKHYGGTRDIQRPKTPSRRGEPRFPRWETKIPSDYRKERI